jgi:hypothetical protein
VRIQLNLTTTLGHHHIGEPFCPTMLDAGRLDHLAVLADRLGRCSIIGVARQSKKFSRPLTCTADGSIESKTTNVVSPNNLLACLISWLKC